jgi:hypothetical protein
MSNATLPEERRPQPITRFVKEPGDGGVGTIKIDGANHNYDHELPPKRSQLTVQGEFTPQNLQQPSRREFAMLAGGPADGREIQVPRSEQSHTMPVLRNGAPPPPLKIKKQVGDRVIEQTVMHGDYVTAVYKRTKRRTEDGLAIFEHQP